MSTIAKLNTFALTLLITGAIDSIRNLPASALFGSSLIFFFIFAALFFLIPTALISAELTANVNKGGIYQWARLAFGEHIGFLAVWLQWVNNIVWFPTILSFIAGTAAYLIDPALAANKFYLVSVILFSFWFLTLINLRGIRVSAKFTSFCAITGLIIPVALIIILLIAWVILGKPIQIDFSYKSIMPNFQKAEHWVALTAIMLGFAGMELATVHVKDVKDPKRTFPKALAISTFIILITMMLGSLAIAMVLPFDQINLVNGTIQTFAYFLDAYNLSWLTPILTVLLVVGSLGGIVSWVVSPIKGICQAAHYGYLPPQLKKENKHGVPQNLLLLQAVLVSISCLAFLFLPSVNASYWLLTALTTQLYMLMYVLMFLAAIKLKISNRQQQSETFRIPGKLLGFSLVSLFGLIGCAITLLVGFIPPSNINIGSQWSYEILFISGIVIMILPVTFFFWYANRQKKNPAIVSPDVSALQKSID